MPSKKHSAASESPPRITLLLDENLQGPKIYGPLRAAGIPVERLEDHFSSGISDEELLGHLARRSAWCLVTKDERMRYRPAVVELLRGSGIGIFVVTATKGLNGEQLATLPKSAWKRMQAFVAKTRPPFVAAIGANGAVRIVGRRR